MAKISWRPGTLMAPLPPVLVSCGTMENPNVMTAAWTGVLCSDPVLVYVSLRPSRYSHEIISQTKEFVINLPTAALAKQVDMCGVKSGRDVDKFEAMGLHAREVPGFPAPALNEAPAFLCCRVRQRLPLGSHDLFLCAIEEVYVRDALFDADGSLHLARANLVAYAHGEYFPLSPAPEGFFGYSVAREDVLRRRLIEPYQALRPAAPHANGKGGRRR